MNPLSTTQKFNSTDFDYVVVVMWSRFMGRQSKRLINLVQDNVNLAGNNKVKVLYVNNDDIFAYGETDIE